MAVCTAAALLRVELEKARSLIYQRKDVRVIGIKTDPNVISMVVNFILFKYKLILTCVLFSYQNM